MIINDLLKKQFPILNKGLLLEIEKVSTIHELRIGESIIGEGDYIKTFPMVLKGCLRVVRLSDMGNELLLYYLNNGEICSMALTCCMGLQKSKIKMIAEDHSVVITIPVKNIESWMSEYRSWKEFMMVSYRKRFDDLLDAIDSIAFMNLDERLIRFFKTRWRATGQTVFNGSHQDIAILLNTSREVITRIVRNFKRKNLVITKRNSIDYSRLTQK